MLSELQKRIKQRRLECGYTLAEVAELIDVKESTVQRYESGEIKNLKYDTMVKLANIFKCSPAYLMGWTSNKAEGAAEYKKADALSDIYLKIKNNPTFYKLVEKLYELNDQQLEAVYNMLSTFEQH